MLAGTFFTAISQVLLKQSANKKYSNPLLEYLNWRVIVAYGIFFGVLLLNTWCYTKVDMRFGPVIDTAAYVFVLIFSRLILNEKITKGKTCRKSADHSRNFDLYDVRYQRQKYGTIRYQRKTINRSEKSEN